MLENGTLVRVKEGLPLGGQRGYTQGYGESYYLVLLPNLLVEDDTKPLTGRGVFIAAEHLEVVHSKE